MWMGCGERRYDWDPGVWTQGGGGAPPSAPVLRVFAPPFIIDTYPPSISHPCESLSILPDPPVIFFIPHPSGKGTRGSWGEIFAMPSFRGRRGNCRCGGCGRCGTRMWKGEA